MSTKLASETRISQDSESVIGSKCLDEYNAGMGTTPGMWEYLSEILADENAMLPESLSNAIYALCDNKAKVVIK